MQKFSIIVMIAILSGQKRCKMEPYIEFLIGIFLSFIILQDVQGFEMLTSHAIFCWCIAAASLAQHC